MYVSILNEIKVRARWDGLCTLEWSAIRTRISGEGCLQNVPGKSDLEKLKTWAQNSGMLMDFDVELNDIVSDIRSVSFWPNPEVAPESSPGLDPAAIAHFHWNKVKSFGPSTVCALVNPEEEFQVVFSPESPQADAETLAAAAEQQLENDLSNQMAR